MESFDLQYNIIYFTLALIGLFVSLYFDKTKNELRVFSNVVLFITSAFLFVLVGFRDKSVGADTEMYFWQYQNVEKLDNREPFYKYFINFLHTFSEDSQFFLLMYAFIFYFLFFYFIIKRKNVHTLLLYIFFFSLFSFKSMSINIIRQGVSIMFLLNAYNFYCKSEKKKTLLFAILSLVFHTTSIIPILLFILSKKIKNYKIGIVIFVLGIILAYFDIGLITLYSQLSFLKGVDVRESYFQEALIDYKVGFRSSFLLFNLIFLFFALIIKKRLEFDPIEKKRFEVLINFYLLASFVFFISFQIPYSDRFGLISWIVIPLLFEPLINKNVPTKATISLMLFVCMYLFFELTFTK